MGDWGSLRVRSDPADSHLVRTCTWCVSMEVALGRGVSCVWRAEPGPQTPMDQPSASGLGGTGGHVSLVTDPLPLQGTLLGCTFPSGNHLHVGDVLFE